MKKVNIFIEAFGRRKESTVRVRLYQLKGKESLAFNETKINNGDILVNFKKIEEYFPGEVNKLKYLAPLKSLNYSGKFAILAKAAGGGINGQLEAFIHALSRALEKIDKENRPHLKKKGFLTRDARAKERRKAGYAQKARARKQSPKR